MELDRETFEWGSYHGKIKIKDMDNNHVLNVHGFLMERQKLQPLYKTRQKPIVDLFEKEIALRNLNFVLTLKRLKLMPWQVAHTSPDGEKKRFDWNKGIVKA